MPMFTAPKSKDAINKYKLLQWIALLNTKSINTHILINSKITKKQAIYTQQIYFNNLIKNHCFIHCNKMRQDQQHFQALIKIKVYKSNFIAIKTQDVVKTVNKATFFAAQVLHKTNFNI